MLTVLATFLPLASVTAIQGPPPTPVPPRGSPSPFIQRLDTAPATAKPPQVQAKAVLLVDLDSGQVLYERRPDLERPIASLTKVMTALLVLEESKLKQQVAASPEAVRTAAVGLSSLGLRPGEKLSVQDLLWALLLGSANDAAVALAEHVSGSVPAFVKLMDRRAAQLGMDHTHFASPNGLSDKGYSSAADLAIVTREAMQLPTFAKMVRTKFHTVKGKPPRHIQNRNVLLWLYPGASGVKTGFTTAAQYNVIATAQRGGRRLLAIVLGEPREAFSDAAEILNYGFKGFVPTEVVAVGDGQGERSVSGERVLLEAGASSTILVPKKGSDDIALRPVLDGDPVGVGPGDEVGVLRISLAGREVGTVPLVVMEVLGGSSAPGATPAWIEEEAEDIARGLGGALGDLFG
ncbi:MAG: D-alanyl-D-alanine carboxypeptidase family protein [Actinomycetota bacterium]